jgi:hypothetical protein
VGKIMKLLSKQTKGEWLDAGDSKNTEEVKNILKESLLCENLLVLCGLGTSLCLKTEDGIKVASTMTDLWNAVKALSVSEMEKIIKKVNYQKPDTGDSIESLLSQCQISEAFRPDKEVGKFITSAEEVIVEKCRYNTSSLNLSTHESFLRRVARRSARQPRVKLFTTNYDRSFEIAATNARFTVIDGFSHSLPQEFDGTYFSYDLVRRGKEGEIPDYVPNVFQLYKLHGSIDWERQGNKVIKKDNPQRALIIYPRSNKFETSYEPPFVEMMSAFQLALRAPNTALLVIVSGLNDKHIVEPIISAVNSNINLRLMVISLELESLDNRAINYMKKLVEKGDSRLYLLEGAFEDVVPFIPDLSAETETEQHERRIKGLP